jgi:ABC-type multidrug transport system fused ATPase/permease subunit
LLGKNLPLFYIFLIKSLKGRCVEVFKLIKGLRTRDWFYLLGAVAFIVIQVWLDLTLPDYTAKLTTEISSNGQLSMGIVFNNGFMMLLCALGSMLSAFACGFCTIKVASSFSYITRERMFAKVTSFSNFEMKKFSTPSLITRTTNDINQVHMFLALGFQMLIKAPLLAVWAICKISETSIEWTRATVVTVLIILVVVAVCISCSVTCNTNRNNVINCGELKVADAVAPITACSLVMNLSYTCPIAVGCLNVDCIVGRSVGKFMNRAVQYYVING